MNFIRIVPTKVNAKKYDTLILQGGSIEVSNLNTKDEPLDANLEKWKKKIEFSSTKMFQLAEQCISDNPGLEVIITERIPRFDSKTIDPAQIKSQLSQYGNSIYHKLWMDKGCPKNIKLRFGVTLLWPPSGKTIW